MEATNDNYSTWSPHESSTEAAKTSMGAREKQQSMSAAPTPHGLAPSSSPHSPSWISLPPLNHA